MLLPQAGIYPDFPSETTLESLLLAVGRRILATQKTAANNPNELAKITIALDETTTPQSVDLELTAIKATVTNGVLTIIEPFTSVTFAEGTGSYPYNRTTLCDAFVHLALYQAGLEADQSVNPDPETRYISINIVSSEAPSLFPLDVTITLTDYPTTPYLEP